MIMNDFIEWLIAPEFVQLDSESEKVLQKANYKIKKSKSVEETADAISDALVWSLIRQIEL